MNPPSPLQRASGLVAALLIIGCLTGPVAAAARAPDYGALERDLEEVRLDLGIPGMAAAIVQGRRLVWAEGFGYADVENGIEATPSTPFGLASVTKPIAATLLMQLVEEGHVDLDAEIADYGVGLGAGITVRHLLTHTSEGALGAVHSYNGSRFGFLGGVMEGATGATFARLLGERIIVPLEMTDTAVNPINSWGGGSTVGFEGLARSLGWGEPFAHFPDVYERLARPYQFDENYERIPGMYQLYHNPAAGMLSSVNDLAAFDIALDGGQVLGEGSRAEMWMAQVQTLPGRPDLAYGLGWYVQEFAGTRLLWHTGRWPPSTSALYLKVPEYDATFIVLANTDNLTSPFPGVGVGDLSQSALMLTFYRHVVFPERNGFELPDVDWSGLQDGILESLAAVEDEASRSFLERELWSRRQVFTSSGRFDQADVLRSVGIEAYPSSALRRDANVVSVNTRSEIVAPITDAESFTWISRVLAVWFLGLVPASLVWLALRFGRARETSVWMWGIWLMATVLVGPIAVALYRRRVPSNGGNPGSGILPASLVHMTGYGAAWFLAVVALQGGSDDANPLVVLGSTLLIPFGVGLLLVRAPLLVRAGVGGYGRSARRGVVVEFITLFAAFAVLFPLTFYVDERVLSTLPHPTNPFFWGMMSVLVLTGIALLMPLHYLLLRRGFTIWPGVSRDRPGEVQVPTLRDSWWLLLASLALAILMLVVTVSAFG